MRIDLPNTRQYSPERLLDAMHYCESIYVDYIPADDDDSSSLPRVVFKHPSQMVRLAILNTMNANGHDATEKEAFESVTIVAPMGVTDTQILKAFVCNMLDVMPPLRQIGFSHNATVGVRFSKRCDTAFSVECDRARCESPSFLSLQSFFREHQESLCFMLGTDGDNNPSVAAKLNHSEFMTFHFETSYEAPKLYRFIVTSLIAELNRWAEKNNVPSVYASFSDVNIFDANACLRAALHVCVPVTMNRQMMCEEMQHLLSQIGINECEKKDGSERRRIRSERGLPVHYIVQKNSQDHAASMSYKNKTEIRGNRIDPIGKLKLLSLKSQRCDDAYEEENPQKPVRKAQRTETGYHLRVRLADKRVRDETFQPSFSDLDTSDDEVVALANKM
jgi:hypothetical protein